MAARTRQDKWMVPRSEELMRKDALMRVNAQKKMIRDEEFSDAFVKEELDRWERFLKLSSESTKLTHEILDIANAFSNEVTLDEKVFRRVSGVEDGTAMLLAVLGRGDSRCTKVILNVRWERGGRRLTEREAIALCANLKSNTSIKQLYLQGQEIFGTPQMCAVLSNALTTNKTLTVLLMARVEMTPVALRCLLFGGRTRSSYHPTKLEKNLTVHLRKSSKDHAEILKLRNKIKTEVEKLGRGGLLANVTVETLILSCNMLFENTSLTVFLSKNPFLKSLEVHSCGLDLLSATGMADALTSNTNLEMLDLQGNEIGSAGVLLIFEALSQNFNEAGSKSSSQLNNQTLKRLKIGHMQSLGYVALAPLVSMLETNKNLVHLSIRKMPFKVADWTEVILPALSKNQTLEELDLYGCGGLNGDLVRQAFFKMVQEHNTRLKGIELSDTGMVEWGGRLNEELRKKVEYQDKLRDQLMVTPTSGRLVLCGYEFAGKTTIRKTMEHISHPGGTGEDVFKTAWKKLMQMVPCLRQILYGTDAPRELGDRTRGFDIAVIDDGPPRISVWDFAGQREYYALHDYLFPDIRNSCFVYVCSCRCPPSSESMIGEIRTMEKMKEDFHFWMRFIASNSKVVGDGRRMHLPYVHFVLTNVDRLLQDQRQLSEKWAESVVEDLKKEFQQVIDLCSDISVVNAHLAGDVKNLMDVVNLKAHEILNSPSEYQICKEVRRALERWSEQNTCNPVMSLVDFQELCDQQVRPAAQGPYMSAKLDDEAGRMAILSYLNDMGDIIYPERRESIHPQRLDFIVVNPRWFGTGVLGHLIDAIEGAGKSCSSTTAASKWNGFFGHPRPKSIVLHRNGVVTREKITRLLRESLKSLEMQDVLTGLADDKLIQLMIRLELCFEDVPENRESCLFVPALFDDATESAAKGERKLNWSLDNGSVYLGRRLQCMDTATTFLTPGFFPRLQVHLVNYLRLDPLNVDNSRIKVDRNLIEFTEDGMQVFVEYSGDIDYFIDILVKSCKSHTRTLQFIEQHLVQKIRDFCASPQGCQGVLLEEALIRPLCVQYLDVCARRKYHSVLVLTLENNITAKGNDYVHHWGRIGNEKCTDYALDLLKGEGSYKDASSSSGSSGSGHGDDQHKSSTGDQLPRYQLSIKDVGMVGKVNAYVKGLMPFKIHLYCDIKEGSSRCKVESQPGRDMKLDYVRHGSDLSLLKPVVKFVWDKAGPGFSIDNLINYIFGCGDMPDIDRSTLQKLISTSKTLSPVSDDDIVKSLENYIAYTPGCLKKILAVDVQPKFYEDFRLRKVEYSQPAGKIAWLCEKHYESPDTQKLLKMHTID